MIQHVEQNNMQYEYMMGMSLHRGPGFVEWDFGYLLAVVPVLGPPNSSMRAIKALINEQQ